MNLPNCVINKSEAKTRKRWLFSTFCFFILYPLALFALFAILSNWIHLSEDALIEPLVYAIVVLFQMWIIWHCSYKKYGTRLLTLWLVVSPFRHLMSIVEILKETSNIWSIGFIVIDVGFFLWWYLLSLQIRKINKTVQERISLAKQAQPI
jgi:hypothetical protein